MVLGRKKRRKSIPGRLRHQVFQRDRYRCVECGATNKETTLHIDHIKPVAKGGTNKIDNLQTLCEKCNLAKHTEEWIGGTTNVSKPKYPLKKMSYTDVKRVKLEKKWEYFDSKLIYVKKQLAMVKTWDEQETYVNQIIELNEKIDKIIKELAELKDEDMNFCRGTIFDNDDNRFS